MVLRQKYCHVERKCSEVPDVDMGKVIDTSEFLAYARCGYDEDIGKKVVEQFLHKCCDMLVVKRLGNGKHKVFVNDGDREALLDWFSVEEPAFRVHLYDAVIHKGNVLLRIFCKIIDEMLEEMGDPMEAELVMPIEKERTNFIELCEALVPNEAAVRKECEDKVYREMTNFKMSLEMLQGRRSVLRHTVFNPEKGEGVSFSSIENMLRKCERFLDDGFKVFGGLATPARSISDILNYVKKLVNGIPVRVWRSPVGEVDDDKLDKIEKEIDVWRGRQKFSREFAWLYEIEEILLGDFEDDIRQVIEGARAVVIKMIYIKVGGGNHSSGQRERRQLKRFNPKAIW